MIFKTGELFAGPKGGAYVAVTSKYIDQHNEEWGFTHAWANEYDSDTVETYKINILKDPDATSVYCQDVRTFDLHDHELLGDIDLQTFPDHFHFQGSRESVRRQIGMAIPPEGLRHILMAIHKTFAGEEYDHIQATPKLQPQILFQEDGDTATSLVKS